MTMNYASLTDDMTLYMLRTDTPYVTKIPDLIEQGIIRIFNNAKDIGFEIFVRIDNDQSNFLFNKPGNWRETISMHITTPTNETVFLKNRTYEYCRTYWPNLNDEGEPKYYSDSPFGDDITPSYESWFISPTPDLEYPFDIIYLGIPLFNAGNSVNFLTQRYPNLLLYSCLLEASLFLDNDQKQAKFQGMFDAELDTILRMNVDRSTDRTVVRDKS